MPVPAAWVKLSAAKVSVVALPIVTFSALVMASTSNGFVAPTLPSIRTSPVLAINVSVLVLAAESSRFPRKAISPLTEDDPVPPLVSIVRLLPSVTLLMKLTAWPAPAIVPLPPEVSIFPPMLVPTLAVSVTDRDPPSPPEVVPLPPEAATVSKLRAPLLVDSVMSPASPAAPDPLFALEVVRVPARSSAPVPVTETVMSPERVPAAAVVVIVPEVLLVMPLTALRTMLPPTAPPSVVVNAAFTAILSLLVTSIPKLAPPSSLVRASLMVTAPEASISSSLAVQAEPFVPSVPVVLSVAVPLFAVSVASRLPVLLIEMPVSPSAVRVPTVVSMVFAGSIPPSCAVSTAVPAWMSEPLALLSSMLRSAVSVIVWPVAPDRCALRVPPIEMSWLLSLPLSPVTTLIAAAAPVVEVPVPPSALIPATVIEPSNVLISTWPAAPPVAAPPSIPLLSMLPLIVMLPTPVTSMSTDPDALPEVEWVVVIELALDRVRPVAEFRTTLPPAVVIAPVALMLLALISTRPAVVLIAATETVPPSISRLVSGVEPPIVPVTETVPPFAAVVSAALITSPAAPSMDVKLIVPELEPSPPVLLLIVVVVARSTEPPKRISASSSVR